MSNIGMVCIDKDCERFGIKSFNGATMCAICRGELFPDEKEEEPLMTGYSDDFDFSSDMMERMLNSGGFQMGSGPVTVISKGSDTFTCPPDLRGCPIAEKAKVYIPIEMYNKWIFLASQLSTEWIAYLKGHTKEGTESTYVIEEMYFPKQKAGGAHVEAEDGEIQEGTIAAVHSHVGMNVFFSKEDEDHFNHNIELVVNNKGEIKAMGRTKLECGRYHRGEADMVFIGCEEELKLMDELKGKLVKESNYQFTTKFSSAGARQENLPIA